MKDSGFRWLGKVPGHWQMSPAFAVYSPKQIKNTGMSEKTVLSLSYGQIVVKPVEKLHGLVPESFETYQIVDPGDIIVRTTDLQNDQTSLRIGFSRHRGIITSAYLCLKARDSVSPEYGYQIVNAYDLLKILYGYGSGLRQNLDFSHIKRMPIPVPPRTEQGAIVRFLNYTDRWIRSYIRAKQKLINLLEEQKQAIIHSAVTRGIDPNAHLKPSKVRWLGDIPETWEIWQVGHFCIIGNGSTPSRGNPAYWSGGRYPWLNSSYANLERVTEADQFVTDAALRECHLPLVSPGSVLVAITGQGKTRGKATVLCIEATINQHLAFLRPRTEICSPSFLQAVLAGAYPFLRAISDDSGSTRGALTCNGLNHFKIALPSPDEQARILTTIGSQTHNINDSIQASLREKEFLREYRARLVSDVVTGKLDVRDAVDELPEEIREAAVQEELDEIVDERQEAGEAETVDATEEAEA